MDTSNFHREIKRLNRVGIPYRINHWSWWAQELPSKEEMEEGRKNLEEHNNTVDFIVTHCCASSTQQLLGREGFEDDIETRYLEEILQSTNFKKWFFFQPVEQMFFFFIFFFKTPYSAKKAN